MKTIGLKIEIDGLSSITENVVKLENELKDLNSELGKIEDTGSKAYIDLKNQIVITSDELKKAKKEQRDFVKEATKTKAAEGSYYDLNQQLVDLRKEYKSLSAAERNAAKGTELQKKIQDLDTELKKIDGSIGQFQRNVGNYPRGLSRITRSLEQVIPGFENFSQQLKNSEGRLTGFGRALVTGFVAFQAAKALAQAVKQLDEFISKINETRETVAAFSGAYGEDLDNLSAETTALAETFDTDAESISAAAQSLSKSLGISFEDALQRLGGALTEGRGNATDYLKAIEEYPEGFKDASGAVTEFSERNKELLDTNRDLAKSQIDVAKRLSGFNDDIKAFGNTVKTGLFLILANIIDYFKPIGAAFVNLGKSLAGLAESFGFTTTKGSAFSLIIQGITLPLRFFSASLTFAINAITNLFNGFKSIVDESPFLQKVFKIIGDQIRAVYDGFNNLPFIFAGVIASLKQLGVNFVNFFKRLSLDTQIFGNQIKEFFGANVDAAINELRRRRAELDKESMSLGEAFSKGFNDAKADADKKAADEARKQAEIEAQKARAAAAQEDAKTIAERVKAQREAAKKLADEREKYAKEEEKQARSRAAVIADLESKIIDASIANIQDAQSKRISEINRAFELEQQRYKKQTDDLVLAAQEREAQLLETFGERSKELAAARKSFDSDLLRIQAEQAAILVQLENKKNADIAAINADFRKKEIEEAKKLADDLRAFRDMALNDELGFIDEQARFTELRNQENLNRLLQQVQDSKQKEELIRIAAEQQILDKIAVIRNKVQALDDAEAELLRQSKEENVQIKQEEYDAILLARQELSTELSALELEQTNNVKANAEAQKKTFIEYFSEVSGAFEQGLTLLDGFLDAANARQEARLNADIEASQKRQEMLDSELQNATGLRKKYLQQQVDNEIRQQEDLATQQEKIQRNAAKRDKAIAVTQSVIQGFLSVSRAAAAPPGFPLNLPSVFAAGALAAAQTALIAAQPLADGGIVAGDGTGEGAVVPVVLPDSGGKVAMVQNIPATSKGDKVLVAAKPGETFLNAEQTQKLLPHLRSIRVPGFATGGLIGGVPTSPTIAMSSFESQQLKAFSERTNAISNQFLTTKVVLVTDDLDEDNENKNRIIKRTTLEA